MARPESMRQAWPGLRKLLVFMRPYVRRERPALAGAFGALFLGVAMRALEPWPLKFLFDSVILPTENAVSPSWWSALAPMEMVALAALAYLVILAIRSLCLYYEKVGFAVVGNRVLTRVRADLFRHVQGLSLSFHNRARSGDLLVRVMGDVGMLKQISVTALMPLIGNVLVLVLMALLMLWMNWKLALVVLVSAPLYWIPTIRFGKRIRTVSREQRKREGRMAAGTMEMIGAMQTVQTLGLEDAFSDKFTSDDKKSLREGVKFRRLLAKLRGTVQLMTGVSTAAVLFYGTWLVLEGELTAGSLLVFLSYLRAAFKPLANFTKYSGRVAKASAASDRVIDLFEREADVADRPDAREAPAFEGTVRFEDVWFSHVEGHDTLCGVDLEIPAGSLVLVTGESGAGKSSLLELIPRLHDPDRGRVTIDGHDVREFTLRSLRDQVGYVVQDTMLFATSIRDNIALARPDASDDMVEAAARLASAHDFIMAQPEGYDTEVGERGVTLSVGQRQRIAVARAALADSRILILDEPTTGLDEANARAVLDGMLRAVDNRTSFLITHEPERIPRFDLHLHISEGRVVLKGPGHQA